MQDINNRILEARRKRRKKSKINVTYTTGCPAMNIAFFNKHFCNTEKCKKDIEKAVEKAVEDTNIDLNANPAEITGGIESSSPDSNLEGVADGIEAGGLGENLSKIKLAHLEALINKLNAPEIIDGEKFDSLFDFTYTVEDNAIKIYDKNEEYHYRYADDLSYELGYEVEDDIFEKIEMALKRDGIIDDNNFLDWYDNVAMIIYIPEKLMESTRLVEAKRDVRRYFIRPQHIYCANKDEVIGALISIGDANCSVYTLNNLENNNDIHKLQPTDIIYYYDEGILYDKNKQRVWDYDLKIKHEEERKKINLDTTSDETKAEIYSDRIIEDVNELDLDFDSVNAFGEPLVESNKVDNICCICGEKFDGYGNNPEPYKKAEHGEKCCDECNMHFVIPTRLAALDLDIRGEE